MRIGELAGEGPARLGPARGAETLARLPAPMMPHLAEELWQALGHPSMLAESLGRAPIRP